MYALDYDVISGAYQKNSIEFFCTVREEYALIILSHCIHFVSLRGHTLCQTVHEKSARFEKYSP
jgi:U3 small nucleolar RNA-associated protein 20